MRQKAIYPILLLMVAGSIFVVFLRDQGQRIIHGVVWGEANPAAGAVVRLRGSDAYVLTDQQGHFAFAIAPENIHGQLTAWSPGYFIGARDVKDFVGMDERVLQLRSYPTSDNPDYEFISPVQDMDNPTACGHCHRERTDVNNGAMPVDEWLKDAHSHAGTNPRFLSLYNGTTVDGAAGRPTTFTFDMAQGVSVPMMPSMGMDAAGAGFRLDFPEQSGSCAACHVPVMALQQGYRANPNQAVGTASEGVTCDFCHKIQNVRLSADGRPDPGLPGVFSIDFLRPEQGEQIFIGPLDDTPGDDVYSPLQNQSQLCAACHSGQFWDIKIYDSFGEWLNSPYSDPDTGQVCQDCHMPHTGVTMFAQLSPDNPLILPPRSPDTIFSHQMPGAADQTLLENAAALDIEAHRTNDRLQVTVRVTNMGAGHDIPTDNPLRNMILLVQAVDGAGQPLPLVNGSIIPAWGGEGDPAKGYYAGQPGVLYAKILADFYTGETPSYAYWRQTRLVSDNRIPPLATDESVYEFDLPSDSGGVRVEARLYLRRAFIDLMAIKGWDTPDILMEQRQVEIP